MRQAGQNYKSNVRSLQWILSRDSEQKKGLKQVAASHAKSHSRLLFYRQDTSYFGKENVGELMAWNRSGFDSRWVHYMNASLENIVIVREKVSVLELKPVAALWYGTMIKGVVDLERKVIALGGDWHMDANSKLIEDGSDQSHLWGFNLYLDERGDNAIEYQSLINIRPRQGNRSIEIADTELRKKIFSVVRSLVPELFV